MKKFLKLSLCALLSLIGLQANAAVTFTVQANPEHFSNIQVGANTGKTDLNYSLAGEMNELDEMDYIYFSFIPKANVTYTVRIYNADGVEKHTWANKSGNYTQGFAFKVNLDGGRVVVDSEVLTTPKMNITVNGDPEKVVANIMGKALTLKAGTQEIEFARGSKSIFFQHATTGKKFYHFYHNGSDRTPGFDGESGAYHYSFTPQDGDIIIIDVDYPEGPFTVKATSNEPDFLQRVIVDGAEQAVWAEGVSVKGGQIVRVEGNQKDYIVNTITVNGVAKEYVSSAIEQIIDQDTEYYFDVTKIVRDKKFVFYRGDKCTAQIINSNLTSTTMAAGYNTVEFGDVENPFVFVGMTTNQSTSESIDIRNYIYVNNELVKEVFSSYTCNVQDGDVVKLYYVEGRTSNPPTEPSRSDVSISLVNSPNGEQPIIMMDYVTPVNLMAKADQAVLPGTVITVASSDNALVTGVSANGTSVSADADGVYAVTVNADTNLTITLDESTGIRSTMLGNANEAYAITGTKANMQKAGLYIVGGKKAVVK